MTKRTTVVVLVLVLTLTTLAGPLAAQTIPAPPLYVLLPFNWPYPILRVCRTDYGICAIHWNVQPGTPCFCISNETWVPGVCIR
jgi:hypothetical protein